MFIRNPETKEWEEVFLSPTGDTFPIGSVSAYAGEIVPTNWLRCDGQEVSRTEYAELFKAIGTTYGAGDSSTTFNLPDLNTENRTIVGSNGDGEFSLGNTGGEKEHTLTVDEMPSHKHNINYAGSGTGIQGAVPGGDNNLGPNGSFISNAGGGQAHNNMQPYIALNYIIKVKQSVGIVGTVTSDINDPNKNAVVNAYTTKNYVDNKIKSKYMIATSTTSSSVGSDFKILLNKISDSYGDNLILENSAIKIGDNISKVRVSGNAFINGPTQSGYVWGQIKKNGSMVSSTIVSYANTGGFLSTPIPPKIINVEKDDEITLIADSTCKGTVRTGETNTWLMVEVVE